MNEDNKRIAKNALLLYCRTFITIIVGIYTGRVMLQALGISNYGIYTVVGGLIGFTSILTGTLTSASTRYISYSLGSGDNQKLKDVFSTSVNVLVIIGIIACLLLEIFGVYWLNICANIPSERLYAANWVLQCSIFALLVGIVAVPSRSCIVSHEKLSIYAYTSVVEVVLRLIIVYLLVHYNGDRLILLSVFSALVSMGITGFYCIFSRYNFEECRYRFYLHKPLLKEMASYSGWTLFGNATNVLNNQGISMLINVFFGVAFNAARGVATTVNDSIQGFVNNFIIAFNPQIIKLYAAGEYDRCYTLVNRASRSTWLLMLIFMVPVCVEANTLLHYWLVKVPQMAGLLLQLAMFQSLSTAYTIPLYTLIQTSGEIKRTSIEVSCYTFLVFPLTWIAYKIGAPLWIAYLIYIIIYFTVVILRIIALKRITTFSSKEYIRKVIQPCIITTIVAFSLPILLHIIWEESLLKFICVSIISVLWTIGCIMTLGLTQSERKQVMNKIHKVIYTK